jgi:hypothetical protein
LNTSNLDAALHCSAHPSTVTYLRCAQCNTPICPRCLVMTPVGAKCRQCARARLQPAFRVRPVDVVVAPLITVLSGVIIGSIASFLTQLIPFVSFLVVLFPIASGVLISRILRKVVPRKHGILLKVAVGLGVVVSFLVLGLGDFILHDPVGLLEPGVPTFLFRNWLLNFVVNPFALLFLALGVYVGVNQVD